LQNVHGILEFGGFSAVVRLPKRLAQYMQNPEITKRPNATTPMIGATNFSIPIPPGCWSMSTASSVKNNAARTDMIPPSMRRPIAIMEVSASLGSPSLAVSPRELILTGRVPHPCGFASCKGGSWAQSRSYVVTPGRRNEPTLSTASSIAYSLRPVLKPSLRLCSSLDSNPSETNPREFWFLCWNCNLDSK
jgi:hypothetical protein